MLYEGTGYIKLPQPGPDVDNGPKDLFCYLFDQDHLPQALKSDICSLSLIQLLGRTSMYFELSFGITMPTCTTKDWIMPEIFFTKFFFLEYAVNKLPCIKLRKFESAWLSRAE